LIKILTFAYFSVTLYFQYIITDSIGFQLFVPKNKTLYMFLANLADRLFYIPPEARERALDRINRSKPVEEDGFHFYALPHEKEERYKWLKQPVALQFHYHGRLYKYHGERTAGVFELFLDLLYVAIISQFSSTVAETPDTIHLVKYVIIFLHAYQIWHDLREIFNSFYTDDILQRALILVVMAFMVIFANNAAKIGDDDTPDETSFYTAVAAYQLVHFILIANWFFYSLFITEHLIRMRLMGIVNAVSFLVRMGLLFVGWRGRIILAITALAIERGFWFYLYSPYFRSHVDSEFSTAVNIEHESDRMTALFIIVLGEFLNAIVVGAPASDGLTSRSLRAVLILVIAFTLNWIYVTNDASNRPVHPLRRSAVSAILWFWLHEPLCAVLVLSGDIAAEFTKESHIDHRALQWVFSESIAIGLFCLWALSMCFKSREVLSFSKPLRMGLRLVDVVAIGLLPLTEWSTTTHLEVITGLLIVTVVWESYTSVPCHSLDAVNLQTNETTALLTDGLRNSTIETAE